AEVGLAQRRVEGEPAAPGEVPAARLRLPRPATDRDPPGHACPLERTAAAARTGPFGGAPVGLDRLRGRKQRADRAFGPLTISCKSYYARGTATRGSREARRYGSSGCPARRSGAGGARLPAGADASLEQLHELRDLIHDHLGPRRLLHELLLRVGRRRAGGDRVGLADPLYLR